MSSAPLLPSSAGGDNQRLAELYDRYAPGYNALDGGKAADELGLNALRAKAIGSCRGRVLEVGVGTGLNLPYYEPSRCISLTAVDLSAGMLREAEKAAGALRSPLPLRLIRMDAASLDFADGSFDSVVDTFSLCVMAQPEAAIREMRRVCAADGKLLLVEHTRSSVAALGAYQDLTAPAAAALLGKGCVYNQDVASMIARSGLRVVRQEPELFGLVTLFECVPVPLA